MNGEGLILPVPQLSMLCQGSPILELLVVLIQRRSYTDCNYTDVNETLCWFGATHLTPELCRRHCLALKTNSPVPDKNKVMMKRTILVTIKSSSFFFVLSADYSCVKAVPPPAHPAFPMTLLVNYTSRHGKALTTQGLEKKYPTHKLQQN